MNVKIYRVYPDIYEEDLKPINLCLTGKIAEFFEVPKQGIYPESPPKNYYYSCEKDKTFEKLFKKLKLNYKFKFFMAHEYDDLLISEGYAHLNIYQSTRIEWLFHRSWLQQSENIKWLLGGGTIAILVKYLITHLHQSLGLIQKLIHLKF